MDASQKTIKNCFEKAGFSKEDEEEDIIPLSQLVERLRDKETEELLVELRRDFQRLRKTCELNRTPEAKQKVITD
ncbi:hypothetical protein QE152_g5837 [Popillia japonica]|uniref:Uncharacterized protein n=1 Tax=Popillia japonica TaxID=7064 RepID=A0AAW1MLP1_POPJA